MIYILADMLLSGRVAPDRKREAVVDLQNLGKPGEVWAELGLTGLGYPCCSTTGFR